MAELISIGKSVQQTVFDIEVASLVALRALAPSFSTEPRPSAPHRCRTRSSDGAGAAPAVVNAQSTESWPPCVQKSETI